MGSEKALLPWLPRADGGGAARKQTLLSAAIGALKTQTGAVMVVAGKNAAALASVVDACGADLVVNPDPDRGQFSSLQTGLREVVARGFDAAMIAPVDCPPLAGATLERLRGEFERAIAAGKWAVAPEKNGRHGHPLLASRALMDAFLAAPVTSNAREVKHAHAEKIEYVPVAEALMGADMNTPDEYEALKSDAEADSARNRCSR
jgi:molybdenum cofactor cytidylyltransferase